jgi:indole-3-glycerol phosphate synthase
MFLARILAEKAREIEARKRSVPLRQLEELIAEQSLPLDLASALKGDRVQLIAEIKRASPSRGLIRRDLDPVALARVYADNGAAAISVLTEAQHFQGSLEDLVAIGQALEDRKIPLLRKDFVFDPYQIYESRAYGADSLLLIAAILDDNQLHELLSLSHDLGMQCLVEVHNRAELERAILTQAEIIGINNRDLDTFEVDLTTTMQLRSLIPSDRIVVSESGIRGREDMQRLRQCGVDAVLIGEALAAADDVAAKIRELL